jgi:hypothetical protein
MPLILMMVTVVVGSNRRPATKDEDMIDDGGGTSTMLVGAPIPAMLNGCAPDMLHLRTYRHFHHLCRHEPALAIAAYEGLREAVKQCQLQMRFHKWDCTQDHPTKHATDFTILHDPAILRYGR